MILLFIDSGLQEPSLLKVNLHTPDTGTWMYFAFHMYF